MKYILTTLFVALVLVSCGGEKAKTVEAVIDSGNLEEIKSLRETLSAEQREVTQKLTTLDDAIRKLDTTDIAALITAMQIKDTIFNHYLELQGNVETDQNVIVYPEYQGTLTRVYVKDGQNVRKGQVLASIDDGGLSSQVSQLEVQEQLAKTTFERQAKLWEQNIGSEIQYLQAKANYEATQNSVNQVKQQLAKTRVTAPFSGVIDEVITEQGTVVAPGQGLFRIVNLNDMYISAAVPEKYLPTVTVGKSVEINFPVLGTSISSKVRQSGNYISPTNRSFNIEVSVPSTNDKVKPNLTAKLKINDYTNEAAFLIPLSVISEDAAGSQYVYKVVKDSVTDESVAQRSTIQTGLAQGGVVEVLDGLKADDMVIVEGARRVQDGQIVKIVNN